MKTDNLTLKEIEKLLDEYVSEVEELEIKGIIQEKTAKTYLLHATNFVRWCKGDFEPGIRKKPGPSR